MDPATGRLRRGARSVSVRAPSCMDADALTKVVWLAEAPPLALLERYGADALVVSGRAVPSA